MAAAVVVLPLLSPPLPIRATRFKSSSTNTASGRISRTSVPANAADNCEMCAVPNKTMVRPATAAAAVVVPAVVVLPPLSCQTDTVGSHKALVACRGDRRDFDGEGAARLCDEPDRDAAAASILSLSSSAKACAAVPNCHPALAAAATTAAFAVCWSHVRRSTSILFVPRVVVAVADTSSDTS